MYTTKNILSIGLKSELLLFEHISEILPRDNYLVVKTLRNPKYISANFVLFKNPPSEMDIEKWTSIFQKEFSSHPHIKHVKLVWDCLESGNNITIPPLRNGFELEHYRTLIADGKLINTKINEDIKVRLINNDEEWDFVVQNQMLFKPTGLSENYYHEFSNQLMSDYKSLILTGKASWFGAFLGEKLIGSLGVLWSSDHTFVFQRVVVNPDFRRLGVCKTMLHHVSTWVIDSHRNCSFVILTENNSVAEHLYLSLGFKAKEELFAIYRYPQLK